LAVLPFALGVVGAGYYGVVNWWGERKLAEHREWLRAKGYAVTLEEYYPPAGNPDDDVLQHPAVVAELAQVEFLRRVHAEPLRSRLAGLAEDAPEVNHELGERHDVRAWFDPPRHATEAEAAVEVLGALVAERERIDAVVGALQRPECAWKVTIDMGVGGGGEEWLGRSELAGDLAILQLAAVDAEAAASLVEAQLKLAAHLYGRPNVLRCVVAQMVFYRAQAALHEGVVQHAWDEATLARLAGLEGTLDPQDAAVGSLRGQIPYFFEWLPLALKRRDPRILEGWRWDGDEVVERVAEIWEAVRPVGEMKLELVKCQQQLVVEVDARRAPQPARFTREDGLEFARKKNAIEEGLEKRTWSILAMVATGALDSETSLALMRTGIALERYRLKHGAAPAALAALVPEFLPAVPLDPYDLRPLRYRVLADGTPHVWSIGWDGSDNGGAASVWGRRSGTPDYDRVWLTRPLAPGE
jgi:hypothetical protein